MHATGSENHLRHSKQQDMCVPGLSGSNHPFQKLRTIGCSTIKIEQVTPLIQKLHNKICCILFFKLNIFHALGVRTPRKMVIPRFSTQSYINLTINFKCTSILLFRKYFNNGSVLILILYYIYIYIYIYIYFNYTKQTNKQTNKK